MTTTLKFKVFWEKQDALVAQQLHQPAEPQPEATGQLTEPMTASEQKRLVELEGLVTKGLSSFLEVGCALLEIRDTRLY
jgi:hypothetical protein